MRSVRSLLAGVAIVVLIQAGLVEAVHARQALTLLPVPESRMWIDGTSNRSDWTVEAKELGGLFVFEGMTVTSAVIEVPAEKIESTVSRIMDRLMYKTIKSAQHPVVSFQLAGATPMAEGTDGAVSLTARGQLSIAGTSKEVSFPVTGRREGADGWRFAGQLTMLLTDFGMEPPTALFGALHTGDQILIRFDVVARP